MNGPTLRPVPLPLCSMSGLLQTSYYFAYMAVFCGAIAIMCGTLGFFSSSVFVNRIYRNIKVD